MVGERGWRRNATLALFILPSLVPLVLFMLGPMAASVVISLLRWDLLRPAKLIGLANYQALLIDPDFKAALGHTLVFIVGYLPLVYFGGLGLALLVNQKLKGSSFFRSAYFLPVVTSWVVVALVWRWLLNPQSGVVNAALGVIGIDGPGWWTDPAWAMPSVILASAWKDLGFVMVILLSGLQAIPEEYYEAAEVDGAGRRARFRHVTLPLLSGSTFFVLVISLINSFQVFDQVWVMTGGGPAGASSVVVEQIVRNAFSYNKMGYASAMSWVLFAIILVVTLVQLRLQRRWVAYV
jgi:multiple sugar transport system permease protein